METDPILCQSLVSKEKEFSVINQEIDFGEVWVGRKITKKYTIQNKSTQPMQFIITRCTTTNPAYYMFDFDENEIVLNPSRKYTVQFTFSPLFPSEKNIDYFQIVDSDGNVIRLTLRGSCIGPRVTSSIKYYTFAQTANRNDKKLKFMLINRTKVPAVFHFDVEHDSESETFRVDPKRGTLPGNKEMMITVYFLPKSKGYYTKQLVCLVLYQKPILVNLFGVFDKNDVFDMDKYRLYPFQLEETVGYRGYLNDVLTVRTHPPPPVSLSVNYLDFKTIAPNLPCQILTTSLTNHMDGNVQIEWETNKNFQILPESLTIPGKKSALYELKFHPEEEHRLFSGILNGQVFWTSKSSAKVITIPIPITLRLIGHSFPNQAWIPAISLTPSPVIVPATLPGYPSSTTFIMRVKGQLPVLFKLLPPENTKFIMKPMVGLIHRYSIIVVQTQFDSKDTGLFVEKWSIELNGQIQQTFPIYVKTQVELPSISAGDKNNIITFESSMPNCQNTIKALFKNTCNFAVEYEFESCKEFGVVPSKWNLEPNEQMNSTCWCLPKEEGLKKYTVNGKLTGFNMDLKSVTVDISVGLVVNVVYSELCSMPKEHDFGVVEYGTLCETRFWLFNLGESPVLYSLTNDCRQKKFILMTPKFGKCGSKRKCSIQIRLTAHKVGTNTIRIFYSNRIREAEQITKKSNEKPLEVFCLQYTCYYSLLQITELREHNFGPLFTRQDIWEFFQIDKINEILANLEADEREIIDITAPESELKPDLFYANFDIGNVGQFDTSIMFKREKNCECSQEEITEGLSQRQKVYNCPHRDVFTIEIPDCYLMKNTQQILSFKVKYTIEKTTELKYNIDLVHDRHILLIIKIHTIPKDLPSLSLYKNVFDLNFIYIGLREAPVQAFWLYNNTSISIPYKVDTLEIVKLCNKNHFNVLVCLNSKGFLEAFTRQPILFKFWPIEVKKYTIKVPVILGNKTIKLQISGDGTDQIDKYNKIFDTANNRPIGNGLVRFSKDIIVSQPIFVGSSSDHLLFIKNLTKTDVIRYKWKPCFIDGLACVEFLNSEGELQPKESHSVRIKVYSLNEPCMVRFAISCELFNQVDVANYEAYLVEKQKRADIVLDQSSLDSLARKNNDIEFIPPPEGEIITIPLQLYAIGLLDKDTCLSLQHQMTLKPCEEICINQKPLIKKYFRENRLKDMAIFPYRGRSLVLPTNPREINGKVTKNVLECIVADAVFSEYFTDRLTALKLEPNPLYSQVKCPRNKNKIIDEFSNKLPLQEICELFDNVVMDSVHETFQLGPVIKDEND